MFWCTVTTTRYVPALAPEDHCHQSLCETTTQGSSETQQTEEDTTDSSMTTSTRSKKVVLLQSAHMPQTERWYQ